MIAVQKLFDQRKNVDNFTVTQEIPLDEKAFFLTKSLKNPEPPTLDSNTTEMQLIDEEKPQKESSEIYRNEYASTKVDLDILDPDHSEEITSERLVKGIVMKTEAYQKSLELRRKSRNHFMKGKEMLLKSLNI